MCAKRKKRRKSIILRLLVLGVAGYMLFTLAGLFSTLREDRQRLKELEAQRDIKLAKVEELKNLLSQGSEEEIIERAATRSSHKKHKGYKGGYKPKENILEKNLDCIMLSSNPNRPENIVYKADNPAKCQRQQKG